MLYVGTLYNVLLKKTARLKASEALQRVRRLSYGRLEALAYYYYQMAPIRSAGMVLINDSSVHTAVVRVMYVLIDIPSLTSNTVNTKNRTKPPAPN